MNDVNELKRLRDNIENMETIHQIHIFKILKENHIEFTENNNGVFINMTLLDETTLKQINNFIKYVNYSKNNWKVLRISRRNIKKNFIKIIKKQPLVNI